VFSQFLPVTPLMKQVLATNSALQRNGGRVLPSTLNPVSIRRAFSGIFYPQACWRLSISAIRPVFGSPRGIALRQAGTSPVTRQGFRLPRSVLFWESGPGHCSAEREDRACDRVRADVIGG